MFSLLIGVGALFLAVLVSTILDPRPRHTEDDDKSAPSRDAITLSV